MWFSNCGDAMIAMKTRNGNVRYMSQDHKVENEKARIESLGGIVTYNTGCARIYGTLNIARSIGDHFLKAFVISDPYVTATTFPKAEIEWISIASDGLWDVYTPMDYADDIKENSLNTVLNNTFARGSMDNVTIIHAEFKDLKP